MKRKLLLSLAALALVLAPTAAVGATGEGYDFPYPSKKVNICHQTESESHPWVAIQVSKHAYDDHIEHGDFDYEGPLFHGKPSRSGAEWCNNNQPNDVCPNIEGKQTEVPEGQVVNEQGNCVDQPETPPVEEEPETPPTVPEQPVVVPVVEVTVETPQENFTDGK